MAVAIVTGSAGLVGSEAAGYFHGMGMEIVGIDNDMRHYFFGDDGSTQWNRQRLIARLGNYQHVDADIRDPEAMAQLFRHYGRSIRVILHAAAQPSHDWAAREPTTDFAVNATGTLNLLESARRWCPEAAFIFFSTNKVYGDSPNHLHFEEHDTRWELEAAHPFFPHGIDESMSIDQCKHSVFGASKTAADIMVQEYGRYFGMNTVSFRCGCLTGPAHSGTEQHGFLAYLARCAVSGRPYTIFGYRGKQVRDNIHSRDLIAACRVFFNHPRPAAVYNMGGGRQCSCSVVEAIHIVEQLCGHRMKVQVSSRTRNGDHVWWISDTRKFKNDYPEWECRYGLEEILVEMVEAFKERGT